MSNLLLSILILGQKHVQVKLSRSPLTCVFIFLLSLLLSVLGSFKQKSGENVHTGLDGLMEAERENGRQLTKKKKRDGERW